MELLEVIVRPLPKTFFRMNCSRKVRAPDNKIRRSGVGWDGSCYEDNNVLCARALQKQVPSGKQIRHLLSSGNVIAVLFLHGL
jgi:hypothetical protein